MTNITITARNQKRLMDKSYTSDKIVAGIEYNSLLETYPPDYKFSSDELFIIRLKIAKSLNINEDHI